MRSINCTHFNPPTYKLTSLEIGVDRLGQYIDAEQETLGRVLAQANCRRAGCSLEKIAQLHLPTNWGSLELRDLLEEAEALLEHIFETLQSIPHYQRTVSAWGLPGPAPFSVNLCWSAARLQDIIASLRWALAD